MANTETVTKEGIINVRIKVTTDLLQHSKSTSCLQQTYMYRLYTQRCDIVDFCNGFDLLLVKFGNFVTS